MQNLGVDLATLRKQVADTEAEKQRVLSEITQLQKCDEIHIQIDVLQSSPEGVIQLKQRYNRLLRQLAEQATVSKKLENDFRNSKEYQEIKELQQVQKLMKKEQAANQDLEE